jgi:hypothetical protein
MKTRFILNALFLLAVINGLRAQQITSWNTNTVGISGTDNSGFGWNALNSTGNSFENTATGNGALRNNNIGQSNTANGKEALNSNVNGNDNTAMGWGSLFNNACVTCSGGDENTANGHTALYTNAGGNQNTAIGENALYLNASGNYNTADGYGALYSNTGSENTAIGHSALYTNSSGTQNTAFGKEALYGSTTGNQNTALGYQALYTNSGQADMNTAAGAYALHDNTSGDYNTTAGYEAGHDNQGGQYNTAAGYRALYNNTSASMNVAIGVGACYLNQGSTSIGNVAIGNYALYSNDSYGNVGVGFNAMYNNTSGFYNTAFGYSSLQMAGSGTNYNTAIGANADMGGAYSNATAIGAGASVSAGNKVRIGNGGVTVVECQGVAIPSDGRFKFNLDESGVKGIVFIKKLRPVVYNFDAKKLEEFVTGGMPEEIRKNRPEVDYSFSAAIRQSGFIAQEVEQAAKEVGYDFNGVIRPANDRDNYGLAYSLFVVPLVKAIQEQQALLKEQEQATKELQSEILQQAEVMNRLKKSKASVTSIQGLNQAPGFVMEARPNPFSTETFITYRLPEPLQQAYLAICDLNGRQVLAVPLTEREASIRISADQLEAGIYMYSIIAGGKLLGSRRLVVAGK